MIQSSSTSPGRDQRGRQAFRNPTTHRLLAAFPDAVSAIFLILVWQSPLAIGTESVFSAIVLIVLEFPALAALSCLFMLHMENPLADRIKAITCLCGALYLVGLVAIKAMQALPSAWLLVSMLSMLMGKALIYTSTRRDSTWTIEGLKLLIHFGVFLTIFSIANDLSSSMPRGGFTDHAMQHLSIPQVGFDRLPPTSPWIQPWWFILAGAVYFSLCAVTRYAIWARKPGV